MILTEETLKCMKRQLAHCFASHGDQPDELFYKLECLLIEWYEKGQKATQGIKITCPHCHAKLRVYHMEWSTIACLKCKREITQAYGQTFIERD